MPFKITITETRTVERVCGEDWVQIGDKEVEREERYYRLAGEEESKEPKTRITQVFGYSPKITKQVSETRQIFEQAVDELELEEVIRAINNL